MIVCAGEIESFRFATAIGVGMVRSAINLTKILLIKRPQSILFVGTAGSYGKYNILDIVESNSASNIEQSFFQNNSYTPIDNLIHSSNNLVKNETIVNSSNYITTNFDISSQYLDRNIGIENMEFFACLEVAKSFNIDIGGIFVVTNYTNNNAHQDFIQNRVAGMEKLTNYLMEQKIIK